MIDNIVRIRKEAIEREKSRFPLSELKRVVRDVPAARDFEVSIRSHPCAVIAEIKRSSPSRGRIREHFDHRGIATIYSDNGAAAISVLTERNFFEGDDRFLEEINETVDLPLLRKDFIVDSYQIYETRALRGDALLLIARVLHDIQLRDFICLADDLGLATLVEVHHEEEVEKALGAGARMIGINNRDLSTFKTDLAFSLKLAPLISREATIVSESGIRTRADIERLTKAHIHAFLIGESLMQEADIGQKLRELLGQSHGHGD
jgi:indole-3-glycerol phosphate synthase